MKISIGQKSSHPFVQFWLKLSFSYLSWYTLWNLESNSNRDWWRSRWFKHLLMIIDWWNAECANCRTLDCDSCKRATDVNTSENIAVLVNFIFVSLWLDDVCIVNKRNTLRRSYLSSNIMFTLKKGQLVNRQCVVWCRHFTLAFAIACIYGNLRDVFANRCREEKNFTRRLSKFVRRFAAREPDDLPLNICIRNIYKGAYNWLQVRKVSCTSPHVLIMKSP